MMAKTIQGTWYNGIYSHGFFRVTRINPPYSDSVGSTAEDNTREFFVDRVRADVFARGETLDVNDPGTVQSGLAC